jgi:hypothetical protein
LNASLIGLAGHVLIFGGVIRGWQGELWEAQIVGMLLLPSLIAFVAAFSGSAPFRTASLTAAFIASVPPMLLLLMFFIGVFLLPGVVAYLVAAVQSTARTGRAWRALGSLAAGSIAGAALIASWWPFIAAYDGSAVGGGGMALGLAIICLALSFLLLTGGIFSPPANAAS